MRHDIPYTPGCPITFGEKNTTGYAERRTEKNTEREAAFIPCTPPAREAEMPAPYCPEIEHADKVPGMVYHAPHGLHHLYDPDCALRAGTLFDELHKPMVTCQQNGTTPHTQKQAAAFTAWELRLYLNTHPRDRKALEYFRTLCENTREPNYACTFMPCDGQRYRWTDDPWPWEYEANAGRRA